MSGPAQTSSRLWFLGFGTTLTLAIIVGTLVPFALGALGPLLVADLDISRTRFGTLTTVFYATAAGSSLLVGPLADRVGGRNVLIGVFAIAATGIGVVANAPNYAWLLAGVAIGGVAVSGANPSTNRLLQAFTRPGRRGTLVGVKQSGAQVSNLLAGALLPVVAVSWGWRTAIGWTSVLAAAGLLSALTIIPNDHLQQLQVESSEASETSARPLALYSFFDGAGLATVTTYVVLYGHERLGFQETVAGRLLAVLAVVAIAARILWGRLVERRARVTGALGLIGLVAMLSTVALLLAGHGPTWLAWIAVAGLGSSAAASNAVVMLAVVRAQAGGQPGRASGLVVAAFYTGLFATPALFGAIVDTTAGYDFAWALTTSMFIASTATSLWWHRRRFA